MYLHVGNQKNIRRRDIIGIFDMDRITTSRITRKYLSDAQRKGLVVSAKDEVPKSFILYETKDKSCQICFSQLSTSALAGRMEDKDRSRDKIEE